MLSTQATQILLEQMLFNSTANEVINTLNSDQVMQAQTGATMVAAVVATSTSTTTNFASAAVGDWIVHIPATAGNAAFETVATKGTKPSAAVVGDLYITVRKWTPAPANTVVL